MVAACAAGGVAFATPYMIVVPFTPIICDEGSTAEFCLDTVIQVVPAARATAQQLMVFSCQAK